MKHNGKGRSTGEPKHVRLYEWELCADAYQSMHPYSRQLLVQLRRRSNGNNNGHIVLGYREAMEVLGAGYKLTKLAFEQIQDRGWAKVTKKGVFTVRESDRDASEWAVTNEPLNGQPASKDYMKWRLPLPPHDIRDPQAVEKARRTALRKMRRIGMKKREAVTGAMTQRGRGENAQPKPKPQKPPHRHRGGNGQGSERCSDRHQGDDTYSLPGTADATRSSAMQSKSEREPDDLSIPPFLKRKPEEPGPIKVIQRATMASPELIQRCNKR